MFLERGEDGGKAEEVNTTGADHMMIHPRNQFEAERTNTFPVSIVWNEWVEKFLERRRAIRKMFVLPHW
jgi:hypothetical protein